MAYSPQTNAMYIPLNLNCEHATFGPGRAKRSSAEAAAVRCGARNYSASGVGRLPGRIPRDGRRRRQGDCGGSGSPSPMNTAALTTAGGLVFGWRLGS